MFFLKKKQQDQIEPLKDNSQQSAVAETVPIPEPTQSSPKSSSVKKTSKKSKNTQNKESKKSDPLEESFDNYAKDSASVETTENIFKNITVEMSQVEKEIKETQKNLDTINAELIKLEKSRR